MASRAKADSSASIASRNTSRWLSSAARRYVLSPGESKSKDTRYLDIHEDDQLDEAQLAAWVKQASQLPANQCEREAAKCVREWLSLVLFPIGARAREFAPGARS
jgi:hypothetical protein